MTESSRTVESHALPAFIVAACVPRSDSHASGALDEAERILAAHPAVAHASIHTAAILGDAGEVERRLAEDPALARAKGGPYGWDALTHLCFSRYLRLDRSRAPAFLRAAAALLHAGASANSGWMENDHQPEPEWEPVLYGAAGIAHDAALTKLLLEHGADPNDNEVVYHTPESWDNAALRELLATGRVTAENLALMLVRKHDWHDAAGVRLLLEHGTDPNRDRWRGWIAINHAVERDNSLEIIELLLEHGADPTLVSHGRSAAEIAAMRGRGDLLGAFERHGFDVARRGAPALAAACARGDAGAVASLRASDPEAVRELLAHGGGGARLSRFAGVGNAEGVKLLLSLGIPVDARYAAGDGYFAIAPMSTALHVASWRARHDVVELLIERGADVGAVDAWKRTPLMLAVKACVDSYWMDRRDPRSVQALLGAGASKSGVPLPTGYAAIDELLAK